MLQFQGELEEVYSGAQTSPTSRWMAANWIDKVLLAAPSVPPIYWQPDLTDVPTWGQCRPIPGLPDSDGWDGVEVFDNHMILWRGPTIKWSASGDFALSIPVAITAASGRGVVGERFLQPAQSQTSDWVYYDDGSGSFVVDQFVRTVANETDPSLIRYDYYKVAEVSSKSSTRTAGIPVSQTVESGESGRIFTTGFSDFPVDCRLTVDGERTGLAVVDKSRDIQKSYKLAETSPEIPDVGSAISLVLEAFPFELQVGDIVSVSIKDKPGQDLYRVDVVGITIVCTRLGVGQGQQVAGTMYVVDPAAPDVWVRIQHWVDVISSSPTWTLVQPDAVISSSDAVRLISLAYTGATEVGDFVPSGAVLETIDANDSGEVENVGALINGDVYAVVTLADYAYVLKPKSIQSIQSVGRSAGTFFFRGEIYEEGPIGRYAWCRFAERYLVFWGNRGWYRYAGGQTLEQVGDVHWATVQEELDIARADEIVAYHNRDRDEVWFAYPVLGGGTRVAIYNYESNSVVIDDYPEDINGITAVGTVDWEVGPTWESLSETELCNGPAKRWYEYVEDGLKPRTLIGIGGDLGNPDAGEDPQDIVPRILAHGRVYYRASRDDCDPQAYEVVAETPDFDGEDPVTVKYVDTVFLSLNVPDHLDRPMKLKVQLGTRMGLDSDIVWTEPATIDVTGAGNLQPKVNLRGAGRYVRLRFSSDAINTKWALSGFRILYRPGGTY